MTRRERVALTIANWRFSIANAIVSFLYVDQAVGFLAGAAIDSQFPVHRIAELEGRQSQCIDDVESMKELVQECADTITELKARIERLENEAEDI